MYNHLCIYSGQISGQISQRGTLRACYEGRAQLQRGTLRACYLEYMFALFCPRAFAAAAFVAVSALHLNAVCG